VTTPLSRPISDVATGPRLTALPHRVLQALAPFRTYATLTRGFDTPRARRARGRIFILVEGSVKLSISSLGATVILAIARRGNSWYLPSCVSFTSMTACAR
jgi:hypothetical protein